MIIPNGNILFFSRACLDEAAKNFPIDVGNDFNVKEEFRSKIGVVISVFGAHINHGSNSGNSTMMCRGIINGDTADIVIYSNKSKIESIEMYFQEGDSMINWDGIINTVDFSSGFV